MNTEKQIKNYIQRQNNWIKANNLKPGDKVLVRKSHISYTKGWDNSWVMDHNVGKILTVNELLLNKNDPAAGIRLTGGFCYPYTVLQKVED